MKKSKYESLSPDERQIHGYGKLKDIDINSSVGAILGFINLIFIIVILFTK